MGFKKSEISALFSVIRRLSSVFCPLFSVFLLPVLVKFLDNFRGHFISQLRSFIAVLHSQFIFPFLKVGDGQVVLGRSKICIKMNRFQICLDAVINKAF